MRVRLEPKKPLEWCIELIEPMNTTLPTQKTKQPSRAGLLFHEILADGIIHAAAVFGIEPDERFAERVANLAWSNGVEVVENDVQRAATLAQFLGEGLETGRSQTQALCKAVGAAVEGQTTMFDAIRGHYGSSLGTRELDAGNSAHAGSIRQLVGEAVLAGLSCRGLAPGLFRAIATTNDQTRLEQQFLCEMLLGWANGNGLPPCHPFLQMAERFYARTPNERQLVCELMGRAMLPALDTDDPWALDYWLGRGWRAGVVQAKFAPDSVHKVIDDVEAKHLTYCRELYRDCILGTAEGEGRPSLVFAFEKYIADSQDCRLDIPEVRVLNPRILAARAYDFTVWMGFISAMPTASGEVRGAG
jgi:hypothetical protein